MRVAQIWRYPIKSVGGEALRSAEVTPIGIRYDRGWGVVDDRTGNVLTARREPRLLYGSARIDGDAPVVTTEQGDELRTSADLSEWLDRPVTLTRAEGNAGGTYESPLDFENDDGWVAWQGPPDAWHDSARSRLSLVSTGSLGGWDFRRFRANVLIDGAGEDGLVGSEIDVGTCRLKITKRIDRCVVVTRSQPGLPRDLGVLRTINAERDSCLAIGARVLTAGVVEPGDRLVST
jgi:uncharacterized protein